MADIKGSAVSWAVQGLALTAGIIPGTGETPAFQSVRARMEADSISYIRGSDGKVVSAVIPDIKKTITMTIIPTADTLAHMRSLMDRFYINPGTKITITDSEGNIEGSYYLVNCSQERKVGDAVGADIELENWSTDLSTSAA